MRRCIILLILLTCQLVGAQEPAAAPPILVLDSGGHTSIVWKVLFTSDGKELISVSDDKTVRFWDVASGEPIRVLRPPIGPGREGKLYAAALSPDGRTLAVGGWGLKDAEGSIYLISTTTGRIERVLKGHPGTIHSLAFAVPPGGRLLLASGSGDKTARIWDVAAGECRRVLAGHTDRVSGVAFAPDASRLATASYDKTARIWSVADGKCLQTLQGHTRRSGPLPGAPMGNSWPPAAMIDRSDSGARTEPSPETSRIWTTWSIRSCSPPTQTSCSTPGAGQILALSARRSCGSPPDRSGCDSPSMTILSSREPCLATAR